MSDVLSNPTKYFWITLFQSSSFLAPVLTLFYLQRGLDYQQIFIFYTSIVVSMFLFEVPTGIFGDKYGRKTSIVAGLVGWIIFTFGLLFADTFWEFFFLFILSGITLTFASGSDEAMIYDSLKQVKKEKQMKKYMGKIISARFLPLIIIAPLGSIIAKDLTSFQFTSLILGNLLFTIIAFFISLSLVEPKVESGPHEIRSPFTLFKMSIQHIRNSPKLVSMFMNKTLILIPGSHLFAILWQPYLQTSGVPIFFFGILTAISSLIIFLLNQNINKIDSILNGRRIIFYTGLLPLVAFVLGALFQNILLALLFYFVIKIAIWLRDPIFSQYLNEHIESHNRATVLSSLSMIDSFFDVIIFLSAAFITKISLSYSFLFSAGLMLLALLFFRVTKEQITVKDVKMQ